MCGQEEAMLQEDKRGLRALWVREGADITSCGEIALHRSIKQ